MLPVLSELEKERMFSASCEVEKVKVLPTLSELEPLKMMPASSVVETINTLQATSSSNNVSASDHPTTNNNLNVEVNLLSTDITESIKTMPSVTLEERNKIESCMTTDLRLPPSIPIHENKFLPLCAGEYERKKNPFQTTLGADKEKYNSAKLMGNQIYDIDLCVIGKIGNGKSSLGNSLVQHDAFESGPTSTSVTKDVLSAVTEFNGRKINVVDGPGVDNTDSENPLPDALASFISINPTGYNAFLLVVKFGGRFTKEDKETVEYLKSIFGKDFVKRYCILVMTYGDLFEKEVNISFNEWIHAQTGILAELVKECSRRVILFDNITKDDVKKRRQISSLIEIIDRLMSVNCRYTNEQFELARSVREAFILSSKKAIIVEETISEADIILQKFLAAQEKIKIDNDATPLEELLQRADNLFKDVVIKDNKSGVLSYLLEHVRSIQSSIREEMKVSQRMAQYMKQLQNENEDIVERENKCQSTELNLKIEENQRQVEQRMEECICQSEAEWEEEKLEYHIEFHRILQRTKELEKENNTLKKKDRAMFTTIRHKVINTLRGRKTFEPETDIEKDLEYLSLEC